MVKKQCPNFEAENVSFQTSQNYFCWSTKWEECFEFSQVSRNDVRRYCMTTEHKKCPYSNNFDESLGKRLEFNVRIEEKKDS